MLSTDESALICDFAETYHIHNIRGLPARTAAALACGLRDDSRIKLKMRGQRCSDEMLIMAIIADRLGILAWQNTKDAQKGRNRPQSIYKLLTGKKEEAEGFATPEQFWAAREKILKEAAKHG